jgi:two-component system, LuxR family, response regulator FixJ
MRWLSPWKAMPSRLVPALLAAALGLFIIAVVALAFNLVRLKSSFSYVEHTNEVLRNISSSERALLEAESGERGYLLTGESSYLDSYNRSRALLPAGLEALRQLVSDNPVQIRRLDELRASIDARLAELEQVVELGPSRTDDALAILKTARSKQLTPRIETQLAQLRQAELSLSSRMADRSRWKPTRPAERSSILPSVQPWKPTMTDNAIIHVIDDDDAARDGLAFLLTASNFAVQDYPSGRVFLDVIHRAGRGCVITDLSMPEMSGIDLLRELQTLGIDWPVIVVTGQGDLTLAVEALRAGAADFIEKPYDADVLLDAVAAAMNGLDGGVSTARKTGIEQRLATLSVEERGVFDRLANGQSTASIAQDLRLDPRTIEVHRANLMTKMQATSLSDLVRMAVFSLIEPPPQV